MLWSVQCFSVLYFYKQKNLPSRANRQLIMHRHNTTHIFPQLLIMLSLPTPLFLGKISITSKLWWIYVGVVGKCVCVSVHAFTHTLIDKSTMHTHRHTHTGHTGLYDVGNSYNVGVVVSALCHPISLSLSLSPLHNLRNKLYPNLATCKNIVLLPSPLHPPTLHTTWSLPSPLLGNHPWDQGE